MKVWNRSTTLVVFGLLVTGCGSSANQDAPPSKAPSEPLVISVDDSGLQRLDGQLNTGDDAIFIGTEDY